MDITTFLQTKGYSRRRIIALLQEGDICIDQKMISYRKEQVTTGQHIVVGSTSYIVENTSQSTYTIILYNKPIGYVVSKDNTHSETIYDILPPTWKDTYTYIGRLDKNSHGLLVLTDALPLVSFFSHPRNNHTKTYLIKTQPSLTTDNIQQGIKGVPYTDPDTGIKTILSWDSCIYNKVENSYKVSLSSGKKRHIRRLCESLGTQVIDLQRVGFGPWNLGDIALGKYIIIEVSSSDVENLLASQSSYTQKQI